MLQILTQYHNGLRHVFDRRRPSLGVYLGTLQGVQNEIRNRIRQLQLGAAPRDHNITLAKEAAGLDRRCSGAPKCPCRYPS